MTNKIKISIILFKINFLFLIYLNFLEFSDIGFLLIGSNVTNFEYVLVAKFHNTFKTIYRLLKNHKATELKKKKSKTKISKFEKNERKFP